jgi:hypothetical protein
LSQDATLTARFLRVYGLAGLWPLTFTRRFRVRNAKTRGEGGGAGGMLARQRRLTGDEHEQKNGTPDVLILPLPRAARCDERTTKHK